MLNVLFLARRNMSGKRGIRFGESRKMNYPLTAKSVKNADYAAPDTWRKDKI